MNNAEFQLRGVSDPRLAVHATSALPTWLWAIDGTQVLWANPVGARLLGAANGAALAKKIFGPADQHRRQIAQLAGRLSLDGAIRLERMRGFGAPLGTLVTCRCARLDFADGSNGVLVTAAAPAGRAMPLVERLQRLVEGIDTPIAAFARDGMLIGASDAARSLPGFCDLSGAGLDEARSDALKLGRVETPVGSGHMVLQRVGSGADVGLVALIVPAAAPAEPAPEPVAAVAEPPTPDYEQPALSDEAPAEFALIDEFDSPAEPAVEAAVPNPPIESGLQPVLPLDIPIVESSIVEASTVETLQPEASPETAANDTEVQGHEPSPYIEAVADEPGTAPAGEPADALEASAVADAPPWLDEPSPDAPRHPLRFMWRMDAEGRFSLDTGEFTRLIGRRTAAGFGRPWNEIAGAFGFDPDNFVGKAIATRDTWSGITLNWPADGGGALPVELAGLPIYDRMRNFAGYRGFGVCRDLDGLARLAALRRHEFFRNPPAPHPLSADIVRAYPEPDLPAADAAAPDLPAESDIASFTTPESPAPDTFESSQQTNLETAVETPVETSKNVLPFRPLGEPRPPTLTSVESSAFNELARQLSTRLDSKNGSPATPAGSGTSEPASEPPVAPEKPEAPEWLAHPEPPARGKTRRDRMLLDLLPVGVLIYRLDRLVYANRAFLERMGYPDLHALEEDGGLDALYVEPGVSTASSTSDTGTPVTISATQPSPEHAPPSAIDARLFTISWDDESALALIFSGTGTETADIAGQIAQAIPFTAPSAVGHANAEELGAILDTTAEGILMFDAEGNINSCNRSAEALFGYDGPELLQRNLTGLFAPESQRMVRDYLEATRGAGILSLLDQGRDVLGRVRQGGIIPLSMTMGRTQPDGPNFFAVFRDLSQSRKSENELHQAQRLADRAATAKADMLAWISHEVRAPLNAIIGFAEVMIGERFGALGNERYVEYMKDIRASGERVIAIINDLTDLSRIETGKLDLAFASQNLNDLVENCVAGMQPQANRERIIIRTSLAHMLPPVVADARALRQITLNLIGNSIHLANAGGQVIVSTALSDFGEVVLRVRDTGHGLNDNEVAAAMEPFGTHAPSDQASDSSGVSLSLTKALVEANRARFHIKSGANSGTLIEVVFSHAAARV
jgi:PAS domain S-box-containing protein